MTWCVLALTGAVLGVFCARAAHYYEQRLATGRAPDDDSLTYAVRAALSAPVVPIIWVDDHGRTDPIPMLAALTSALMLAGLHARHGAGPELLCIGMAVCVLVMLSCIDVRLGLLPDALTRPLLWLGLVWAWAGGGIDVHTSVGGVLAGYILLTLPRWLWWHWRGLECMGAGDAKLLAATGAWVGVWGVVHVLMLACLACAVFAVLHQRRWRVAGAYPFGPFLAGAILADFLLPSGLQSVFYV